MVVTGGTCLSIGRLGIQALSSSLGFGNFWVPMCNCGSVGKFGAMAVPGLTDYK